MPKEDITELNELIYASVKFAGDKTGVLQRNLNRKKDLRKNLTRRAGKQIKTACEEKKNTGIFQKRPK